MSWSLQSFWKPRLGICVRLLPLHFVPKAGIRSEQIQEEVKHVLPLNDESYNRIVAVCSTPHSWVEAHRMFVSATLSLRWLVWNMLWSKVLVTQSFRLFATPWTVANQAPLSMGFSRQEFGSGSPSPGDLPNLGIKPGSPALQADSLPTQPPEKPGIYYKHGIRSYVWPKGAYSKWK